ncbi:TetR/AcrR family transcriptional regulator [Thioclava nitratireducens]|uniref:TetR/AcrR family transcriptional regulator n=1 Tax=Thioclava nitratireducens TaxID=1915078 RepID=UPI002480E667|nr:TetR/AcrR family transcriptional regulator [Thioclava nitratireducens]WGT49591.1 TetR/AcrR family transcriptional regulator [Thioclava nitratireducens]
MTTSDSPEPKFRRRAEARPDEVLDAALTLFEEKGYAHTSVAQIAKTAGLSKGAVYLYFPSKQAILEGLVRRAVSPIAARAQALVELSSDDARGTLRALFSLIATSLSDPKVLAIPKVVIREAVVAPEIAAMYRREVFDHVLPAATEMVRQGIASGQLRPVDPELTLRSVIGPIVVHLLLAEIFNVVPEGGLAIDQLIENHLDILFHGVFLATEGSTDA